MATWLGEQFVNISAIYAWWSGLCAGSLMLHSVYHFTRGRLLKYFTNKNLQAIETKWDPEYQNFPLEIRYEVEKKKLDTVHDKEIKAIEDVYYKDYADIIDDYADPYEKSCSSVSDSYNLSRIEGIRDYHLQRQNEIYQMHLSILSEEYRLEQLRQKELAQN